jgi:hypothetical protein
MSQLELEKLIEAFKLGILPKQGIVSLYGDFFGKPGDTISTIAAISVKPGELTFDLGREKVKIINPSGIIFSKFNIEINNAKMVLLDLEGIEEKENEKAFTFYTW